MTKLEGVDKIDPKEVYECTQALLLARRDLLAKHDARCVWIALLSLGGGLGNVLYRAGVYTAAQTASMMSAPLTVALEGAAENALIPPSAGTETVLQ